jgi:hypothetical protein
MGLYGGIQNSKFSEGGNYITPGVYRLEINKVFGLRSRTNKDLFGVEFLVLEKNAESKHKIGEQVSWMLNLANEPTLGNIKQFIQSVAGDPNADVTETDVEKILNEDPSKFGGVVQPFKGFKVRASFVEIDKKRSVGKFTKGKFFADDSGDAAAKSNAAEKSAA